MGVTCLKSTTDTPEQNAKYIKSQQRQRSGALIANLPKNSTPRTNVPTADPKEKNACRKSLQNITDLL